MPRHESRVDATGNVRVHVAMPQVRIAVRRGAMDDQLRLAVVRDLVEVRAHAHVAAEEPPIADVAHAPRREVVHAENVVAVRGETVGEMRTDEARSASDQDAHIPTVSSMFPPRVSSCYRPRNGT